MLSKCCCCVELRTGAIVIAVLQILGALGNLWSRIGWETLVYAAIGVACGLCLLFGAIKNNAIGTLINLILTALGVFWTIMIAGVFFYFSANADDSNVATYLAIAGVMAMIIGGLNMYFWICVFSFYKELKSGQISSPA